MGSGTVRRWGTHSEFCQLYEKFLDAVYLSSNKPSTGTGRWRLYRSIGTEIRRRDVATVLDCSAGTGFPALNLAQSTNIAGVQVHCTDGDVEMLRILARRARNRHIKLLDIRPPGRYELGEDSVDSLCVNWADLGQISTAYDYVMCRGNSLAYANTWDGGSHVSSTDLIADYLTKMSDRVLAGGYLHVDAPWNLELPYEKYPPVASGSVVISEQVKNEADYRFWQVTFDLPTGLKLKFERFSSLLTIYDVQFILDDLGFEDTTPFALPAERPGYGVIIARKPG